MKKFFEGGRPTLDFVRNMMGEGAPETILPKAIAIRLGVRVATDPWPLGDAPIQSFSTFEALLLQARPQLHWKGLELHTDEDQLRQTTAEAVLFREMQRLGIVIIFDTFREYRADERVDWAEIALRSYFNVGG